jgi:hypothetical protein
MPSVPHPTMFVRREVYERFGNYRTDLTTAMDYEWLLRVTGKGVMGYHMAEILAGMRMGGLSDKRFTKGYREVMAVSVDNGYGEFSALLRYWIMLIKGHTRRRLEKLGFRTSVRWYRELTGSRYRYKG